MTQHFNNNKFFSLQPSTTYHKNSSLQMYATCNFLNLAPRTAVHYRKSKTKTTIYRSLSSIARLLLVGMQLNSCEQKLGKQFYPFRQPNRLFS